MPVGGLLVSQVICPSLRLSSPRPQSTSTAPNSQQQEFDNCYSSSTHQPTAALQIDQSLYRNWKLCRQPRFTACSARESTTTEITGPKLIGYKLDRYNFMKTIQTVVLAADVFQLFKRWKTSAGSTTVWMVETQLCKLSGTSDAFV